MCVPGCMETIRAAPPSKGRSRAISGRSAEAANGASAAASAVPLAAAAIGPFAAVLDLTHTLSPAFPGFPGDPPITMTSCATLGKDGYNMNAWHLVEHCGTHLDAPMHFSDNGASVDAIEPSMLVVPLAVVDVVAKARENADYLLSRDDLAAWEKRHGRLPQGGCVVMHSGWGRLATTDPARFVGCDAGGTPHFPGVAPQAAEWLLRERQIAGLAVDTLSLDHGPSRDFPTHRVWLPAGRWGLENVANLERAPAAGAMLVIGLPKMKDATGAPVRLLALIPA